MLFVGPQVVAEDEAAPANQAKAAGAQPYAADTSTNPGGDTGTQAAPVPDIDARAIFTDKCGSCHTLSAAGTSGDVGPNLDETTRDAAGVEDIMRSGSGSMPSFDGELGEPEISAVAAFVAGG
jgi:mono/diheme cytochrome c family protein